MIGCCLAGTKYYTIKKELESTCVGRPLLKEEKLIVENKGMRIIMVKSLNGFNERRGDAYSGKQSP